jgi:hypothetical protein
LALAVTDERKASMRKRLKTSLGAAAALAALALGGAAIGNAATGHRAHAANAAGESTAPENSATDGDNVQDTTTPDQPGQSGSGTESGSDSETGSEQVNGDGPGGHADEPGNPNADHQFQGQE